MAKPEAYGKTSPVSTCPICHDFMLPEEYDKHVMTEHTKDQRERHGVKVEEKPGPKGHFYGDVWSKYDEQQPYQFTQAEFDAITKDAWEADCEQCRSIIENTEMDGSEYAIHPTSEQKAHMTDLFGYSAERVQKPTGYLDPEDPQWQKSVEHIQERQKKPGNIGTFGPQSGMRRGEPTRDEWQIASYLDSIGLEYIHKMKLGEIDPTVGKPKVEYDLFIPSLLIAIETSPGWHEGGPSELARVAENDKFKRKFAKENGIELFVYDPDEKFGSAEFINTVLAPELRTHGVDAPDVPAGEIPVPSERNEDNYIYGDPRFNEWDTATIYREEGPSYDWDYSTKYREKPILEEQTDIPEGVVPPEGYARQTTEEAAIGVLDHLIKGGVESFESWDEVIEHLQFLVDTGYIANFQPPNISEEEFKVWEPLIKGLMIQQTRWPDLKEQSGIPQNIPTGAYTRLEPLTQDQSQNFPRFPERGKVNTIEQQSGGPELEAQNILKLEEEIKKLESQV